MKDTPYRKYELGKEEIGLDIGPSTIAIVGESKAELKEFCEEVICIDKEKRRIQSQNGSDNEEQITPIIIKAMVL